MHINKFYQCLVHYLSNLTMHLLLLFIQSKSIIFYADLLYISLYLTINISNIFPLLQWNFDGCRLLQLIYRSFGQFYIFWYCFLWNSKKNKKSEMKQISNNGTFFCPSACLNSSISLLHTHEN